MRIGNLNLTGQVLAAPLAGISNRAFRAISIRQGAAMAFTEMISSEGLIRNQQKSLAMARFGADEQPIGVQLFGAKPEVMSKAAAIICDHVAPDLIDINFGCPVRKVVNKNGGAAVMKDLVLTEEIIRAVVEAVPGKPVTIKIRMGWDDANPVYLEAGQAAERAGAKAVTLHARSRAGGFEGKADWSSIRRLKESVKIAVIGNGDVRTAEDARRMLDETGCDAVMIGRAALGNPFIFGQINHYLETGEISAEPSMHELVSMTGYHARLLCEQFGEERGCLMMRRHYGWYLRGFANASEVRKQLVRTCTLKEMDKALMQCGEADLAG